MLKFALKTISITFKGVVFLTIIVGLLSLIVSVALPMASGYKAEIEARVSDYLNTPVTIGHVDAKWDGYGPRLNAVDVAILESNDRQIELDRLDIDLNLLKSMWFGTPVIDELTLVGADMSVEYEGLNSDKIENASDEKTKNDLNDLAWVLNAGNINLENAKVTLIDPEQKSLQITDLNISARNRGDEHFLRIEMMLPPELGGQVYVRVDLDEAIKRFSDATGSILITADQLKLAGWRAIHALNLNSFGEVSSSFARIDGVVDLKLWGDLDSGQLATAQGKISASNIVDVRNDDVVLDSFSTDIRFANKKDGWVLNSDAAQIKLGNEVSTIDSVEFAYEPEIDVDWRLTTASDMIPLALALRLPALLISTEAGDQTRRDWLVDAAPSGVMHRWKSVIAMNSGMPDVSAEGSFYDVALGSAHGLPGVKNIAGSLAIRHNEGSVTLLSDSMVLDYPRAFREVVSVDEFRSELFVDFTQAVTPVVTGETSVVTHGVDVKLQHQLRLDEGLSPYADVEGLFKASDMARLNEVLPMGLFNKPTQRWFDHAFQGGKISNGELALTGRIDEFPYTNDNGEFKASFDFAQGDLRFLKTWPDVEDISGRVNFAGRAVTVETTGGVMAGVNAEPTKIRISNLKKPLLKLSTAATGELGAMIEFGKDGPLKRFLGPALANAAGEGLARVDLDLSLPLMRPKDEQGKPIGRVVDNLDLNGNVFLKDNTFAIPKAKFEATAVTGAVGFDERGVRISNLAASYLNQPIVVRTDNSVAPNDAAKLLIARGVMDAGEVLSHYKLPLAESISGDSQWTVTLDIAAAQKNPEDGIQLVATSDLVGTRLQIPQPLSKSTAKALPITVSAMLGSQSKVQDWSVNAGGWIDSRIVSNADGFQSLAVSLGGGEVAETVEKGIAINGVIDAVGIDGWVKTVASIVGDLPASDKPKKTMPVSIDVYTPSLVAGTQSLGVAHLVASNDEDYIYVVLENPAIQGKISYPREHWTDAEPVKVRIAYADKNLIDALGSDDNVTGVKSRIDPRVLPSVDMQVEQFVWNDVTMRNLALRGKPDHSGMQIEALGFATGTTQLIGDGYWRMKDPQSVNAELTGAQQTRLNLTLQSDDFGDGFRYMGLNKIIDDGEGRINAVVTWPDALYSPKLAELNGRMDFDLERGRIVKIDPGAARLVGLFALQAIPRRLSLDFNDMVKDGLDFDTVKGRVELAYGISNVSAIQLAGPVGVVEVTGETNLLSREFDQTITVLPRVSSALPVIGAITGGASGGIGVLVIGGALKAMGVDFDRIGLREYTLTGTWDEPNIQQSPYDPQRGY